MNENYLMNYDTTTGEIKGFYLKSIHGDNIPTPNVEITPEKHEFYMENNGKYKLNVTTLEDEIIAIEVKPSLTLEERITLIENLQLQQGGLI